MTGRRLSTGPPQFVVVEDEPTLARVFVRTLAKHGGVTVAGSLDEALRCIAIAPRLTGLVADIALPDGSGLDVARAARARVPGTPVLLISGTVGHDRLTAAQELDATYLLKPVTTRHLALFAERAIAREQRAATLFNDWVDRYGLSDAESGIMRLAIAGFRREEITRERGVSLNTTKHQIGSLLLKVGATTLAELAALFLSELSEGG